MVPCLVVMLKYPVARTATRPLYVPTFFPLVTTAFTRSPLWKPKTSLACFGPVRGKPCLLIKHICLLPCPCAVMRKGTTALLSSCSGVLSPTQAASLQWSFGSPRMVLFHLVRPPDPHSTGKPNALSCSKSNQRVLLTAAASLSGALICARMRCNTSGCFAKNTRMSWIPLAVLQGSQARQRLLTRSVPPVARG